MTHLSLTPHMIVSILLTTQTLIANQEVAQENIRRSLLKELTKCHLLSSKSKELKLCKTMPVPTNHLCKRDRHSQK
jgi:hypothetical protein